jgi:hypothetical protein
VIWLVVSFVQETSIENNPFTYHQSDEKVKQCVGQPQWTCTNTVTVVKGPHIANSLGVDVERKEARERAHSQTEVEDKLKAIASIRCKWEVE